MALRRYKLQKGMREAVDWSSLSMGGKTEERKEECADTSFSLTSSFSEDRM